MRVSWTTGTSTLPVVYYGMTKDNLTSSASGVSRTYTHSDLCGPPANSSLYFIDPGFLHDVLLTKLQPKSYKFGSNGVFSEVKSFTTAFILGDTTPFKFIMYGDMETSLSPGAVATARLVKSGV